MAIPHNDFGMLLESFRVFQDHTRYHVPEVLSEGRDHFRYLVLAKFLDRRMLKTHQRKEE